MQHNYERILIFYLVVVRWQYAAACKPNTHRFLQCGILCIVILSRIFIINAEICAKWIDILRAQKNWYIVHSRWMLCYALFRQFVRTHASIVFGYEIFFPVNFRKITTLFNAMLNSIECLCVYNKNQIHCTQPSSLRCHIFINHHYWYICALSRVAFVIHPFIRTKCAHYVVNAVSANNNKR